MRACVRCVLALGAMALLVACEVDLDSGSDDGTSVQLSSTNGTTVHSTSSDRHTQVQFHSPGP